MTTIATSEIPASGAIASVNDPDLVMSSSPRVSAAAPPDPHALYNTEFAIQE